MRDAVTWYQRQSHRWVVLGLAAAACLPVGLLGVLHASQNRQRCRRPSPRAWTIWTTGANITVDRGVSAVNNCPAAD